MSFRPDTIESMSKSSINPYHIDHRKMQAYEMQRRELHLKDHRETAQQKLERELTQQFRNNNFRLPERSFVIIAQAGKYLVLAIILPPYMFFYGAPKWMLDQISPFFLRFFEDGREVLGKLLLAVSAWSSDLYTNFAEALKKLKPQAKEVTEVAENRGDNLFQILGKNLTSKSKQVWTTLSQLSKTFSEVTEQRLQALFTQVQKVRAKMMDKVTSFQNTIAETFIYPLQTWMQNKTAQFQSFFQKFSFKKPSFAPIKKAFIKLETLRKALLKKVQHVALGYKEKIVTSLKELVQAAIVNPLNHIKTQVAQVIDTTQNFVKACGQTAKAYLAPIVQPFFNMGLIAVQRMKSAGENGLSQLKQTVTTTLAFLKGLGETLATPILKLQKSLFNMIKENFSRMKEKGKEALKKALTQGKAALFKSIELTKKLPSMLWSLFKKLLATLYRTFKKGVHGVRLVFTWTKILVKYSLSQ